MSSPGPKRPCPLPYIGCLNPRTILLLYLSFLTIVCISWLSPVGNRTVGPLVQLAIELHELKIDKCNRQMLLTGAHPNLVRSEQSRNEERKVSDDSEEALPRLRSSRPSTGWHPACLKNQQKVHTSAVGPHFVRIAVSFVIGFMQWAAVSTNCNSK